MEGAGEAVDGPEGLGDGGNDSVVFGVGVRVGGSEIVGGSLVIFVQPTTLDSFDPIESNKSITIQSV